MTNDIINLLNEKLRPLNMFSKMATAQTETLPWKDGDNLLRLPAYLGADGYEHLTPTTKETGIVSYNVLSHTPNTRGVHTVRLRVVFWVNRQAVDPVYLSRLLSPRSNYAGSGQVSRMSVSVVGLSDTAKNEFSGFDLNDGERQFLTAPYRTFSIDLECTVIAAACAINTNASTYC